MKLLLLTLIVVLVGAESLNIDQSLAPGLSVKNVVLYIVVMTMILQAALNAQDGGILRRPIDYPSTNLAFLAIIGFATLSFLFAALVIEYPGYTLFYGLAELKGDLVDYYLIFLVCLVGARTADDAMWLMKWMLIFLTVGNVLTLFERFGFIDLGILVGQEADRLGGARHPNEYATLLAFFIPATIAWAYISRSWQRWLWVVSTVVWFICLALTASRAAVVGLLFGAVAGAFLMRRYIRFGSMIRTSLVISVGAVGVLLALWIEFGELLRDRFLRQSFSTDMYDVSSGRLDIWREAISMMASEPISIIIGFGWKSFNVLQDFAAHNFYLDYFFNLGILGLGMIIFLFCTVIANVFRRLEPASPDNRILLMAFLFGYIGLMVTLMFGVQHGIWLFIWAQSGLILSFAREFVPTPPPIHSSPRLSAA